LRHGAQLTHVQRFAQVHFHVPADLVSERHEVLRLTRQIRVNPARINPPYAVRFWGRVY
jgi:hypothetical protein